MVYRPTRYNTFYQGRWSGWWPEWGHGDLQFVSHGAPGQQGYDALGQHYAWCRQGGTYAGERNDACGDGN